MKRLTILHVAKANFRVNKKAYFSLFLGILTAVYLATATSLCAWGTLRSHEEQMAERVGWMDMILMGNEEATDEQLLESGFFSGIGHVTVNACVEGTTVHAGYYDETAAKLMGRKLKEGRLPEKAGEIAAEKSALARLNLDKAAVGDTLKLTMHPVNGTGEEKSFILVGILNEQTDFLETHTEGEGMRFPALLVSPEETYGTGSAVVHRVLTYAPLITYNQVMRNCPVYLEMPYGVSREEGMVVYYDSGWARAQKILNRIMIWAVLGAALMLSACVSITSSMESVLARKTEDIGMLRAIGATKRQIRRIYGVEAWVLTVTALPAGMLAGLATAWLASRIAPDQSVFSPNAWLLIPILGLSALCVFIGSRVPLYHAARQMPMGVLRDTALLRRGGMIRYHRTFRPEQLIAERRARLYPLRHLGAAGMTALSLFSALMLGEVALGMNVRNENAPAFQMYGAGYVSSENPFVQIIPEESMSRDDLLQVAEVPGVARVRSVTELMLNLVMDEAPEYFRPRSVSRGETDGAGALNSIDALEGYWAGSEWLFYSDRDLADALARRHDDYTAEVNVRTVGQMHTIRSRLGLSGILVPVHVLAADLEEESLKEYVADGTINMDLLDSGKQVLVYAPTVCAKQYATGGLEIDKSLYPDEVREEDWDVTIRNDAFTAGMPLDLLELTAYEGELDEYDRLPGAWYQNMRSVRADTTVGAVLSGPACVNEYYLSGFTVVLSAKGAEALGLVLPGAGYADIWLAGEPTRDEENAIANRISQIARSGWAELENKQQQNREYMAKKWRQMLLFAALILLFFAVSVFMQVSGATRQIRSEARTIGTLRAVGADLKILVGCYRLPVWMCSVTALVPNLAFYILTEFPGMRLFRENHPAIMIPILAVMTVCIALACIAGIRARLAAVTRQSIVDNIREL